MVQRARVTGMQRLRGQLEDLPEEIRKGLVAAVKESAEAVQEDTKRAVPVGETQKLRDGVDIVYDEDGLVADVGWHTAETYYATFIEHGTRRMPAQPSLGPAIEAERPRMRGRISDEVRRYLR